MQFLQNNFPKVSRCSGFSVIELIVAISILATLSTVMLMNYNSLNKRLALDTLAHEIALWVRQTQVSAMSVKRHVDLSSSVFPGYGLHFQQSLPRQFVFFADLSQDYTYNPPTGVQRCGDAATECEQTILLKQNNTIEKICGSGAVNPQGSCPDGFELLDAVDITFTRPDPDAKLKGAIGGVQYDYGNVQITVMTPSGYKRLIDIWTTGQVSVQ